MEQHETRQVTFYGEGAKLFGIYIVNILLTLVTLGLYYPWARAALLKYMYEESEFEGSRFTFHGTGKEMFIGFIKAIGIFPGPLLHFAGWNCNKQHDHHADRRRCLLHRISASDTHCHSRRTSL